MSNETLQAQNDELTGKLDQKVAQIALLQLQIQQTRPHLGELHKVQCLADERLADIHRLKEEIATREGAKQAGDIQMQHLLALISPPRKPQRASIKASAQAVSILSALKSGPLAEPFQA